MIAAFLALVALSDRDAAAATGVHAAGRRRRNRGHRNGRPALAPGGCPAPPAVLDGDACGSGAGGVRTAFFFQQVHLTEVKGWEHVHLVALFPDYTAVAVATTLSSGAVIGRVGTARLLPVFLLPMGAGFLLLSVFDSLWGAAAALALIAATNGAAFTLLAAFWAQFYGTRHIGAIKAIAAAVTVFGIAVGPALAGLLIDAGTAFPQQMPGIARPTPSLRQRWSGWGFRAPGQA